MALSISLVGVITETSAHCFGNALVNITYLSVGIGLDHLFQAAYFFGKK